MPEHFHLLISEPERSDPSVVMQVLELRFACQVLDASRARGSLTDGMLEEGHVWQRRFYDFVVWSEAKRVEKVRYMHRNPVKRGLVLEPDQWDWSSFLQLRPRRIWPGVGKRGTAPGAEDSGSTCGRKTPRFKRPAD
jgi:REP-associated tyrosine transposase